MPKPTFCLFTDGSCDSRTRCSGWGFVLQGHQNETEGCGSERSRKINRMELLAVVQGLEELPDEPCTVIIFTDSLYVINGSRNHGGEVWARFHELTSKHEVHFVKVGSRNQHPTHIRAHHLAREAVFNGLTIRKGIPC